MQSVDRNCGALHLIFGCQRETVWKSAHSFRALPTPSRLSRMLDLSPPLGWTREEREREREREAYDVSFNSRRFLSPLLDAFFPCSTRTAIAEKQGKLRVSKG